MIEHSGREWRRRQIQLQQDAIFYDPQSRQGVDLNLIEYLLKELGESKSSLGKQLLNRPWHADALLLAPHIPQPLLEYFVTLQRDIRRRLNLEARPSKQFFRVETRSLELYVLGWDSSGRRGLLKDNSKVWANQLWTQILEDFNIENMRVDRLSPDDQAALIAFYSIAHACYSVLAGLYSVQTGHGREIALERNAAAEGPHRLYWFSHYWSRQSLLADHLLTRDLIANVHQAGRPLHAAMHASGPLLKAVCDHFIDKYLSLHPGYLHLTHQKDRATLNAMMMRLRLIVFIYLASIQSQLAEGETDVPLRFDALLSSKISRQELYRAGFAVEVVQQLVADCTRQPVGDRFLNECSDGKLQVGDLSLKFALQIYCSGGLTAMEFRGDWFDTDYIANHIRDRVPPGRYRVHPGIKNKKAAYDADLIIEDSQTKCIYFCQVKHRIVSMLPHLRDELAEYSSPNGQMAKGLKQLKSLQAQLASDHVLERVRQAIGDKKLDADTLVQRAKFLLIHNIENLDFCTSDGVVMYEWNTLRNLMKGEFSEVGESKHSTSSISNISIHLDDPAQVVEALSASVDARMHAQPNDKPSSVWRLVLSSQVVLRVNRKVGCGAVGSLPFSPLKFSFPLV